MRILPLERLGELRRPELARANARALDPRRRKFRERVGRCGGGLRA